MQLFLPNPNIQIMNRQITQLQIDLAAELRNIDAPEQQDKLTNDYKDWIEEIERKIEMMPPLVPTLVIEPVRSFGERSLLRDLPRAGTTQCLTECFFAIVSKDSYIKLLRKGEMEVNIQMMNFLKQIPYIKSWIAKEISQMKYLMKTERYEKRGMILAKEGTACNKIFIFREGEFEITKQNMNNVFYNSHAGTVAILESNGKTMIKSNYLFRAEDLPLPGSHASSYQYMGTDL